MILQSNFLETPKNLFLSLRPQQWVKNLFVLAALFFAQDLFKTEIWQVALLAFFDFILASCAVYLFNDLVDLESDRLHPLKKNRPLPSGLIAPHLFAFLSLTFGLFSLLLAFFINEKFFFIVILYFGLNLAYTLALKKVAILDLLAITLGFVLRAIGGAEAINVSISPWLVVCTFFVALFLVTGKRIADINNNNGSGLYEKSYLDKILIVSLTSTILSYVLYTINEQTVAKFQTTGLLYSTIFVVYGLFRYFYLVESKRRGQLPTETLLTDWPIVLTTLLWAMSVGFFIYQERLLFLLRIFPAWSFF